MEVNNRNIRLVHQVRRKQEVIAGAYDQRLLRKFIERRGKLLLIGNPFERNFILPANLSRHTKRMNLMLDKGKVVTVFFFLIIYILQYFARHLAITYDDDLTE